MARDKITHQLAAALLVAPLVLGAAPPEALRQAVAAQRDLVAERPDSAGALNDLGNLLVETGELEQAEEVYRRAMGVDPGRPEPPFNLALLLAATDRPKQARKLLKAMLEQNPDHAWGHYQLGTLLKDRGDRSRALRRYREAFRLDPSLADPRRNPHVLDNSLATAAMLEALPLIAPRATVQRIYVEPTRISGLLLPPLTAEPSAAMPGAAAAEPAGGEEVGAEAKETAAKPGDG